VEDSKEENTYNDRGILTSRKRSEWNPDSNKYILMFRWEQTYDENGWVLTSVTYFWDYQRNRLYGSSRTETTYDEYGNTPSVTTYAWDTTKNDWIGQQRLVYTFDYAYEADELFEPFGMRRHKITNLTEYAYEGVAELKSDEWIKFDEFIYHYSDLAVSGVADLSWGELSIFPNPATDYIQVEGDLGTDVARVFIYNVSGRIVMNQVLDNGGRIPVSHLSEGIYVIRLVQGDKVKTAKVMIE
jgi:hypothetical protein